MESLDIMLIEQRDKLLAERVAEIKAGVNRAIDKIRKLDRMLGVLGGELGESYTCNSHNQQFWNWFSDSYLMGDGFSSFLRSRKDFFRRQVHQMAREIIRIVNVDDVRILHPEVVEAVTSMSEYEIIEQEQPGFDDKIYETFLRRLNDKVSLETFYTAHFYTVASGGYRIDMHPKLRGHDLGRTYEPKFSHNPTFILVEDESEMAAYIARRWADTETFYILRRILGIDEFAFEELGNLVHTHAFPNDLCGEYDIPAFDMQIVHEARRPELDAIALEICRETGVSPEHLMPKPPKADEDAPETKDAATEKPKIARAKGDNLTRLSVDETALLALLLQRSGIFLKDENLPKSLLSKALSLCTGYSANTLRNQLSDQGWGREGLKSVQAALEDLLRLAKAETSK